MSKQIYYPPVPFENDIDFNAEADCEELDKLVFSCIHIAMDAVGRGLKADYPLTAAPMISEIIEKMKDTHEVIRDFYKFYGKEEKPHQVIGPSIARQQLEVLYNLVYLLQLPKEAFVLYEQSSLVKLYQRFLYEAEEHKNLERYKEPKKTTSSYALLLKMNLQRSRNLFLQVSAPKVVFLLGLLQK